jgi:hypothetical protein
MLTKVALEMFILRLYLDVRDPRYEQPLLLFKFLLDAQYAS